MRLSRFCCVLTLVAVTSAATKPLSANVFDAESAWLPEVEELLRANIYCSADAAARAVARRVVELLAEAEGSDSAAGRVGIAIDASGVEPSTQRAFAQALEEVSAGRMVAEGGNGGLAVALRIAMPSRGNENRVLRVELNLPRGAVVASAPFVDKNWVQSPANSQRFVCVRDVWEESADPRDPTPALAHAVEAEIVPRVLRLMHRYRDDPNWVACTARNRILGRIESSPVLADRFQQTFYKRIDDVDHVALQREAVLLDLSDDNLREIAHGLGRELRRAQAIRRSTIMGGGVAICAALLLGFAGYRFLNRITQGYYEWRLRLATAAFWLIALASTYRIASAILNSV